MKTYVENDIKTLVDDPIAKEVAVAMFLKMQRKLYRMQEPLWGPVCETLSQIDKQLDAQLTRISEEKRKK